MKEKLKKFKESKLFFPTVGCFVIILLIICTCFYQSTKPITITKAFQSLSKVNKSKFLIEYIKDKEVTDEKENTYNEQISIGYKGNYQKSFEDNAHRNVSATDGVFHVEVESMKLGFYSDVQTVTTGNNLELFMKIDSAYYSLFNLPEDKDTLYLNLENFSNEIMGTDTKINNDDLKNLESQVLKGAYKFLNKNKFDFRFLVNDEQTAMSGAIGRFNYKLTPEKLEELKKSIKENVDKEYLEQYKALFDILDKTKLTKDATIVIDVYKGFISNITFSDNNGTTLRFKLENVNKNNEIVIPSTKNVADFNHYVDNLNIDWSALFGTDKTLNDILTGYITNALAYMGQAMEASEAQDFETSEKYIQSIATVIDKMSATSVSEEEKEDFDVYVDLIGNLYRYTILYNQQCLTGDKSLDSSFEEIVEKIGADMEILGIDANMSNSVSENSAEPIK